MARTGPRAIISSANLIVLTDKIRYTLYMKHRYIVAVILVILSLIFGATAEYAYANMHKHCSCCSNQCQSKEKCHENTKECICRYPAPIQVYLLKDEGLPKLGFLGFFVPKLRFIYVFLSAKDIFHPPKTNLF